MLTHAELLSTPEQIRALAESLRKKRVVGFDTEFIRENTFYPIVEILQVATEDESWLVDARAFKKAFRPGPQGGFDPAIEPLLEVLQDPGILKIVHAAQGDQECLYTSFGIVAKPSLDTAVAASLCGLGEGVGLSKLLKSVLNVEIKKGHARTNWSVRPLPDQLIEYAHADVVHLVELGNRLLADLEKSGRKQWAMDLSARFEDKSMYEPDIVESAHKLARGGRLDKRGYGALLELLRWRESRVRHLNLPRRWVADDAVLVDLAHVRPKDMDHLAAFRGLNKGELRNSGEQILAAIRKGPESPEALTYKSGGTPRAPIPTTEEAQVLDLLKCYVGILADQHKVAAKHLASSAQLLPLLRQKAAQPSDLAKLGLLSDQAAGLIGQQIIDFIRGRRGLVVDEGQIRIVEFKEAKP